jgi:hypothetical protein
MHNVHLAGLGSMFARGELRRKVTQQASKHVSEASKGKKTAEETQQPRVEGNGNEDVKLF